MQRREFLGVMAAGAASAVSAEAARAKFKFLHLTDTHIQPELRASEGCRMCFQAASKLKADFALAGGDMVFDVFEQNLDRAKKLFALYGETVKYLDLPVHTSLGNHDVFGISPKAGVSKATPGWGKKMFEDQIGPRYKSFDHKGWHFIILDSVDITPAGGYRGLIDAEQMEWLKQDIAQAGSKPTVALTHIPLLSAAPKILRAAPANTDSILVANAVEVIEILMKGNLKMVLQGHTHICEKVEYKGCQFITTGAVSGNWWRGPRLGFPEGFGLIQVQGDRAEWSYRTYGFQASAA
ncbi:MAG: metallophosphoesterase [Bryobacteraceae bacterium]|nr:metallophosphoesterase [Bryobacteraceae bacterium]MDW8377035.1 metallophosphoesterase [Bryobacterales bacterium]